MSTMANRPIPSTSTSVSSSPNTTATTATPPKSAKAPKSSRGLRTDSDLTRYSKTLSYILRHGASKEGLKLRDDGFVNVDELLKRPKLKGLDFVTLKSIVDDNEKQRFTLSQFDPANESRLGTSGGDGNPNRDWWIRANQGHSIKVEALALQKLEKSDSLPVMVHGTKASLWPTIAKEGLKKMARNHIHCAKGLFGDENVISGMRANCDLFIYLDVEKLLADDIPIYTSSNEVLLTEGKDGVIEPKYFAKVETKVKGGQIEQIDLSKAMEQLQL